MFQNNFWLNNQNNGSFLADLYDSRIIKNLAELWQNYSNKSILKNPLLFKQLFLVKFVEKYGSGIKMMKSLSKEWGNKEPYYNLHPVETKVIFESQIKESTYIEEDVLERPE